MDKLRCLVIERDRADRELVRQYIEKIPTLELVAAFPSSIEAMLFLQENPVDLLLMDFQMPDLNSVEFLQMLNPKPLVIFTTAHKEYAWEGFQLDAVDFLIKPLAFHDFFKAINKAMRLFRWIHNASFINTTKTTDNNCLIIKSNRRIHRIALNDICYIEGMKEYVSIHTRDNNRLLILHSLKNLEELLPAHRFLRIHKSYIIAIEKATILEGNIVYLNQVKLPVGDRYKTQVFKTIFS